MNAWLLAYIAGVVLALIASIMARTGNPYTDRPIFGCILFSVLWPMVVILCLIVWIDDRVDDMRQK